METCKSGSEGGCRKPVAFAIRRLCPTLRDLLQNYTAATMLANSEFVALLKQANTDSSKMAEVIGVSEAQLRFVTNTQSGMGLMKCGNVVIPFDNQIEKGTDLYNLYNTNIHEKIALEKAKEINC